MNGTRSTRNLSRFESLFGPEGEAGRRIQLAILMLSGIIVVGTTGYIMLGWDFLDALYMTVITVGTIGFEEVNDLDADPLGRVWTIILIISGVAVLGYATTSLVALAVEGTVRDYFRGRRMRAEISKLDGHYILCGYGRVGRQVAAEFDRDGVPFVVIEQDQRIVEECREKGHLAFLGEASDDDVLEEVGISRATGLVAAVDSDADNVFVTLSARKLNPALHIVARASTDQAAAKLEIAADDLIFAGDTLVVLGSREQVDRLEKLMRGEKLPEEAPRTKQ